MSEEPTVALAADPTTEARRDLFAAAALIGVVSKHGVPGAAFLAFDLAEAMLAESAKRYPTAKGE